MRKYMNTDKHLEDNDIQSVNSLVERFFQCKLNKAKVPTIIIKKK